MMKGAKRVAQLRVLAIEPYGAHSHQQFLAGLAQYSVHDWTIKTLPARAWKWRMRTAALHFARWIHGSDEDWHVFFVSDYLNLAEWVALLEPRYRNTPIVLYFHENQLTYPLQPGESLDHHFALTHFYSMLCADQIWFNSEFHRQQWQEQFPKLLKQVPDIETSFWWQQASEKTSVMPLGTELEWMPVTSSLDPCIEAPIICWNHRWEYDKNPAEFLAALIELQSLDIDFKLVLLGQQFKTLSTDYLQIIEQFAANIIHHGFCSTRSQYLSLLAASDIIISTASHEFFGLSTLEALRLGLYPVLPNKLAYPELLPAHLHQQFLYESGDCAKALAEAILNLRSQTFNIQRREIIEYTQRYHWPTLRKTYDEKISALLKSIDAPR